MGHHSKTDLRRRIVILHRYVAHYRVPFFDELERRLAMTGLTLEVVYGKSDLDSLAGHSWAYHQPSRTLDVFDRKLLWQPAMPFVRKADLVVVEQASRLLINYYLATRQGLGWDRLAFWGHGKNFQATKDNALAEKIKKRFLVNARWWFAYTGLTKSIVESLGFPADRITDVQNAIDTSRLKSQSSSLTVADRERLVQKYGLVGTNVGLFCGSMYGNKRLEFLIAAAEGIRHRVPDFELILVGTGPDEHLALEAASKFPWVRYVGPKYDMEKVELFSLSKVFLMPGLVGLAILDAFALGTPIVTTDFPHHSPEIHYLQPGHNGLMTDNDIEAYSLAVAQLLEQPRLQETLSVNAFDASKTYTIENMAENFHRGILSAIRAT